MTLQRDSSHGGFNVFLHKPEESPVPWPEEGTDPNANQASWMMEIGTSCAC